MRDFYDNYILSKVQGNNIDKVILREAIRETSKKRSSVSVLLDGKLIIKEVFESDVLYNHWTRYQKEYSYAKDISWDEIKEVVFEIWDDINFSE